MKGEEFLFYISFPVTRYCRRETVILQKCCILPFFFFFLPMHQKIEIELDFPLRGRKVYKRQLDASFAEIHGGLVN